MRVAFAVLTGRPERKRIAHLLREVADGVDLHGPRGVVASMSVQEFWNLTEPYGWGTKTRDYKAIKKDLMSKLTPEQANEMRATFDQLKGKLYHVVTKFEKDNHVSADVGDDSFSDLLCHIIGLGKAEYEECLKDPMRVVERGQKGKFTESFGYALPWKADYKDLDVGKYVKWANEIIAVYENVLKADEDDIPWLPKIKGDVETILKACKHFVETKDKAAFLKTEEACKAAAENVEKYLSRLNVGYHTEDGTMADTIRQAANKWFVWNLFTDVKDWLK